MKDKVKKSIYSLFVIFHPLFLSEITNRPKDSRCRTSNGLAEHRRIFFFSMCILPIEPVCGVPMFLVNILT